jgi:hypothetical protein
MATAASIIAIVAATGAVASWIAGAVFYVRMLRALSGAATGPRVWSAIVAWPFAYKQMTGDAAGQGSKVNKALVAFFTCVMIGVAATSLATNLSRLSR